MRYISITLFLVSLTFATSFKIFPSSAVMKPGDNLRFSAVAYNEDGTMYSPKVNWTSTYGSASKGKFRAPMQPGHYSIIASWNGYVAKAQIHVKKPFNAIQKIVITPRNQKIAVKKSVYFKALAYDSYGRVVKLRSPRWWCSGGKIDQNGYFTAGYRPGHYDIWVEDGGIKASAHVNVIREVVVQPKIKRIQVTPYSQKVGVGGYHQFKAVAYDNYNRPIACNFKWSSDYGTISNTGYFQAGHRPGRVTIWAEDPYTRVRGSAAVTVTRKVIHHPPSHSKVTRIVITPRNQRVNIGESVRLKAIGYDSYGSEVHFSPKWWTNYGSIDQSGYYRAHDRPGRYEIFVKARHSNVQTSTFVEVVRGAINYPDTPQARIDITYWDVDKGSYFSRSEVKVKFKTFGPNVHRATLFGIYRNKKTTELKSASCTNGQQLYFKKKFAYQIYRLEIRVYDSYGEVIARYSADAK